MFRKNKPVYVFLIIVLLTAMFSFTPSLVFSLSDDLKTRLDNAVVLYTGSCTAYVDNVKTLIDTSNAGIAPVIKNGRTLVPARFISESFGADVSWNNASSTAVITLNGITAELQIGNGTMVINNNDVTLDASAEIINGRTFVPLRRLAEDVLGKKVFYDRGLIIISDTENIFDKILEKEIIDEIISMITGSLFAKALPDKTEGEAVLPVSFTAGVSGGMPPYTCSWDFDSSDGLHVDKYHRDATFVYGAPGTYTATLTVKDSRGTTVKSTVNIKVKPREYVKSEPIKLFNVKGTPGEPYIIEGLDLTAVNDNAIKLINCSNVIIRNNYIHDVTGDDCLYSCGILVQDSSNIRIQGNYIANNMRSCYIVKTPESPMCENIKVYDNVVTNTKKDYGIFILGFNGVDVYNNYLKDTGDLKWFENNRITGIEVFDSNDIKIHDNISINCSSDGMGAAVTKSEYLKDPSKVCRNVDFYNNTSRDNNEMGIWLQSICEGNIYNNYIENNRAKLPGIGSRGIFLEQNVSKLNIFKNVTVDNQVAGIDVTMSHDNNVYENLILESNIENCGIWVNLCYSTDWAKTVQPDNNIIRNNIIYNCNMGIRIDHGDGNQVLNNTIYGYGNLEKYKNNCSGGIITFWNAKNTVIKNNIVVSNRGSGIQNLGPGTKISCNDVWKNKPDYDGITPGKGDISADPLFVDAGNCNFRLRQGSPCIDAGDPESGGKKIDMGAYGDRGE